MKIGTVRDRGRLVPTAQLEVMGEVGEPESVSALVDAGFTEWFALPLHVIERLGLQPVGSELLAFGNLAQEMVNVYEAYVYWGTRLAFNSRAPTTWQSNDRDGVATRISASR